MLILDQKDGSIDAKYTLQTTENGFLTRKTFKDCWYILTDDTSQTEDDVRNEFVPLGTERAGAFLKEISPQEIGTVRHPETGVLAFLYEVDLDYDSEFNPEQGDDNPQQVDPDDPTSTRPTRRTYCEQEERVIEYDAENTATPIQTKNSEPILVTRPRSLVILEISRFEPYYNSPDEVGLLEAAYVDHTNNDTFYGKPIGGVWMKSIETEEEVITATNGSKSLWLKRTYRMAIGSLEVPEAESVSGVVGPHDIIVLHSGHYVRPEAEGKPELYLDPKTKQPMKVNLAADGTKLEDNDPAVYLGFRGFPRIDFGPLLLEY